MGEPLGLLSLN